jgi:predicted acylesterase/phospholipase RssA/outer membrane translocation and assembly module TamA
MPFKRTLIVSCIIASLALGSNGERPKIGLALSGGGALGFAHIGLLQLLDSLDIPIDYIAGTSMGGLAGALYACGYTGKEIEQIARQFDWQELFNDRPARALLPYFQKKETEAYQLEIGLNDFRPVDKGGVIAGQKIGLLFNQLVLPYLTVADFDSLPIPFRCVAVDLITGSEVILRKGQLARAMRATMAVPSIFSPVKWGDSLLIDGGLLNNFPADVARAMGAEIVIGSIVANPYKSRQDIRTFWDVMTQSYNILRDLKLDYNADKADILLRIELRGLTQVDFSNSRIERIIAVGKASAHTILPQLLELKAQYALRRTPVLQLSSADQPIIGKISLQGNKTIPDEAILHFLGIAVGQPFYADSLKMAIQRLERLGDYRQIRWMTRPLSTGAVEVHIELAEEQRPLIHAVDIRGNQRLSFGFIYRSLGITPGEIFSVKHIEERINYLYGLGYFNHVTYSLEEVDFNRVRLVVYVDELPPEKIRLGLRYDNHYNLTVALAYQSSASWLQGLRLDAEWQTIGRQQLRLRLLYPTRFYSYPVYPFIDLYTRQWPAHVYSLETGRKIARYQDRSSGVSLGWGFLYQNWWNIENSLQYERTNAHPDIAPEDSSLFVNWHDEWWKLHLASDIDRLDNAFAPRSGSRWHLMWERVLWDAGPESRYTRYEASSEVYWSWRKHTWRLMGYGGTMQMRGFSNRFIYAGGLDSFVGMDYDQIAVTQFVMLRGDWYWEMLNNVWFTVALNAAFGNRNELLAPGQQLPDWIGGGVGMRILTPVGPINMLVGLGPQSLKQSAPRVRLYFEAGYNF